MSSLSALILSPPPRLASGGVEAQGRAQRRDLRGTARTPTRPGQKARAVAAGYEGVGPGPGGHATHKPKGPRGPTAQMRCADAGERDSEVPRPAHAILPPRGRSSGSAIPRRRAGVPAGAAVWAGRDRRSVSSWELIHEFPIRIGICPPTTTAWTPADAGRPGASAAAGPSRYRTNADASRAKSAGGCRRVRSERDPAERPDAPQTPKGLRGPTVAMRGAPGRRRGAPRSRGPDALFRPRAGGAQVPRSRAPACAPGWRCRMGRRWAPPEATHYGKALYGAFPIRVRSSLPDTRQEWSGGRSRVLPGQAARISLSLPAVRFRKARRPVLPPGREPPERACATPSYPRWPLPGGALAAHRAAGTSGGSEVDSGCDAPAVGPRGPRGADAAPGSSERRRSGGATGGELCCNTRQAGRCTQAGPTDAQPPKLGRFPRLAIGQHGTGPGLWPGYAPAGPVEPLPHPETSWRMMTELNGSWRAERSAASPRVLSA